MAEIETYSFRGTDIRVIIADDSKTWLNVNDVHQVLELGWPDQTDEKMMDLVDAHRIAKNCNNEASEPFIIWLAEQFDADAF